MESTAIYKGKSDKYKGVYLYKLRGKIKYKAGSGSMLHGFFETEREAAVYYDKQLINKGKEPVNILKRV